MAPYRRAVRIQIEIRLAQLLLQQAEVPHVRLEVDVGDVAGDGHDAEDRVEGEVADHARLQPARRTELARLRHQVQTERGREQVACDGHDPEQRVEADPGAQQRQLDRGVEQLRQV